MNPKEKASSAITAVFPYNNSIADFVKDSQGRKRLQSFIEFAARNDLIETPTDKAFRKFIDENSCPSGDESWDHLTLEELINNKKEYLNVRLSNRALVDKINDLIENNALDLPPVSSAMFTRLKKQAADTPHKRDALRSFAFWIGYERGDMGRQWHYEALKNLCNDDTNQTLPISCGIRIAFSINSRGNIISQDIINWIKRTIRGTLNTRADFFPGANPPKLKNYDLMTFQVDLPNADQNAIPSSYANTLKEAITIAHQIAIQWIMSEFSANNRFFSIGIAAGDFEEINNQLQGIVNVRLPEDPVIRLTDYARQCVMINHIKLIVNHAPKEIELVSGEAFKVWWITELSGMIDWDLVPEIIRADDSEKGSFTSIDIMRQMMIPNEEIFLKGNDAIIYFLKYPHHSMLGSEIVRALICKNKIPEALEILNTLLRVTPHHLNSRIMRMTLYKFLGAEAPNFYLTDMIFKMAEEEADYIIENLSYTGENFYFEYALLKLARFSAAIQELRKNNDNISKTMNPRPTAPDLIQMLDQAERIIVKGIIVSSPTFDRILYLFLAVQVLKIVLSENIKDNGEVNPRLTCPSDKIKHHTAGVIISLYKQAVYIDTSELNMVLDVFNQVNKKDDDMIALEAFKPAELFIRAAFCWDILPVRNVYVILKTIEMLETANHLAKACAIKNEAVYSIAGLAGLMVSADDFISQVDSIIREIEKRYKKKSELEKLDPNAVIGRADDDLVLMTYHV